MDNASCSGPLPDELPLDKLLKRELDRLAKMSRALAEAAPDDQDAESKTAIQEKNLAALEATTSQMGAMALTATRALIREFRAVLERTEQDEHMTDFADSVEKTLLALCEKQALEQKKMLAKIRSNASNCSSEQAGHP